MGEHLTSGPFSEITGIVSYFHDYQRILGWGVGYSDLYTVLSGERKLFLKALNKEHGASTENLARLQREYKIFEMLYGNEHIVRCIGWREDAEVGPCIVMEYVDGETLADYLKTSPSNKDRKRILNELLDALAFIHSHQVVHNDLKPENILITRNGHNVKLIDFGYADCDSNSDKATGGTIAYASPELLNQEVTDATSDIYSLGFIIKALFPHRYGGIVRKCQCKKASRRYRNVEEVRRALSLRDDVGRIMWPLLLAVSMLVWFFLSKAPISQSSIDNEVAPTVSETVPDTVFVVQVQHDTVVVERTKLIKQNIDTGIVANNPKNALNLDSIHQVYKAIYDKYKKIITNGIADGTLEYSEFALCHLSDFCIEMQYKYLEMMPKEEDLQRVFENDYMTDYGRYYEKLFALFANLPNYTDVVKDDEPLYKELDKEHRAKLDEIDEKYRQLNERINESSKAY